MPDNKGKNLPDHILTSYGDQIELIQSKTLEMAGLVEASFTSAIKALINGDTAVSKEISISDYKVNAMEIEIDEKCNAMLATGPVATDLRTIIVVMQVVTDLERVGDESEKIARNSLDLDYPNIHKNFLKSIENLGTRSAVLLRKSIDAYARKSVDQSLEVVEEDSKLDEEYEACMRQLITYMMQDHRHIKTILDIANCARGIERIGDHAKNIAQHTVYLIKGKDIRHTKPEDILKVDLNN
tara:strand:+ start:203 stop:925 length:723 start_codon:yes stop_codon:yes gene_type:complete